MHYELLDQPDRLVDDKYDLSKNPQHLATIKKTKKSSIAYMLSAFLLVAFGMWLKCIWVLQARTFFHKKSNNLYLEINIILYVGYFFNAITSLTNGILSDKYGCDKMLLFIVFVFQIGCLLQAFASNIANLIDNSNNNVNTEFIIYSAGWIIFNMGGGYVTVPFAYIAKMIPHNAAVLYQGRIYSAVFCAVVIAPVISGLISHYISYRWSIIILTVLNGILFLFILINNLKNKQSVLLKEQLHYIPIYKQIMNDNMNDEETIKTLQETYFFPMCINYIEKQTKKQLHLQIQKDDNAPNASKSSSSRSKTWLKFIGILLAFSFVNANEVIFDAYYTVYCNDRFNSNIMISTIQLSVTSIPLIIGFIFIPKIYEKYPKLNANKLYIMVGLFVFLMVFLGIIFPKFMNKQMLYWFVLPVYNLVLASLMMNVEIIFLELQPKSASGAVNGIRALLKQLLSAFSILLVSFMWASKNHYVWMWYGPLLFVASGFIIWLSSNCIAYFIK